MLYSVRNIFLSLGSPDGVSALPPPERQQGNYFWVKYCASHTAAPCIIQSVGHKESSHVLSVRHFGIHVR